VLASPSTVSEWGVLAMNEGGGERGGERSSKGSCAAQRGLLQMPELLQAALLGAL